MTGRLAVALLTYVALDFANPLQPGAVDFVAGSVPGVRPERARVDDPAVAATASPPHDCPVPPRPVGRPRPAARRAAPGSPRVRPVGRRPGTRLPRAPASDDH